MRSGDKAPGNAWVDVLSAAGVVLIMGLLLWGTQSWWMPIVDLLMRGGAR